MTGQEPKLTTHVDDSSRDELLAQGAGGSGPVPNIADPVLREKTTEKLESSKVRFRRWKSMTIGARISLVILILIVLVWPSSPTSWLRITPMRSSRRVRHRTERSHSALTTRVVTCCPA